MPASYDRNVWNPSTMTTGAEADLTPKERQKMASTGRTSAGYPTIGATGSDVQEIQSLLGISIDGKFGAQTLQAVKTFQDSHNLVADGIVGPMTLAALRKQGSFEVTGTPRQTDEKTWGYVAAGLGVLALFVIWGSRK